MATTTNEKTSTQSVEWGISKMRRYLSVNTQKTHTADETKNSNFSIQQTLHITLQFDCT